MEFQLLNMSFGRKRAFIVQARLNLVTVELVTLEHALIVMDRK